MSDFVRTCAAGDGPLPPKHLRVQLAPPDQKWHEARVHGLSCLIDFLSDEEEKIEAGKDGAIFKPG